MNAPRSTLSSIRCCALACGLVTMTALAGCAPSAGRQSAADDPDECAATAACGSAGQIDTQVRLDTEAMLAGMAHARARLGLQEDAAP